jgi:hypothetical protein
MIHSLPRAATTGAAWDEHSRVYSRMGRWAKRERANLPDQFRIYEDALASAQTLPQPATTRASTLHTRCRPDPTRDTNTLTRATLAPPKSQAHDSTAHSTTLATATPSKDHPLSFRYTKPQDPHTGNEQQTITQGLPPTQHHANDRTSHKAPR